MKRIINSISCFLVVFFPAVTCLANDLQINEVTLENLNETNHTVEINFHLTWENAWWSGTDGFYHDAAWIFAKYRIGNGNWMHSTLSDNESDFTATPGEVETVYDGKGVYILPVDFTGMGYFESNVTLLWKYGVDNVSDSALNVKVSVFGIEMVYIPGGDFTLGDSDNIWGGGALYTFIDDLEVNPVLISDVAVKLKQSGSDPNAGDEILEDGIMVSGTDGIDTDGDGTLDNTFYPTGYDGFYVMKYEISQGQYAVFLNHITASQAETRYPAERYGEARYSITGVYPDHFADYPDLACNFISWRDGSAYADWAGLRPMTELEFEKVCRGPAAGQSNVFPWGSDIDSDWPVLSYEYQVTNIGSVNEMITNPMVGFPNLNYTDVNFTGNGQPMVGVLRCGIFAYSTLSITMKETGAAYYGVMDMLGNLWETCITVGTPQGRAFTGLEGDGYLSILGNANTLNWPTWENYDLDGFGHRGGNFLSWDEELRISYRNLAAYADYNPKENHGFRCVRSVN